MKIYKLSTKFRLFIVFLCSTLILRLCLPTSFPRRCHVCCKLTWSSVCFSLSFIFTQICLSSISFLFPRKLTASHVYPPIAFEMKGKHTEMEKWFQTLLLETLEFSHRWHLSSSWGGATESRQGSRAPIPTSHLRTESYVKKDLHSTDISTLIEPTMLSSKVDVWLGIWWRESNHTE